MKIYIYFLIASLFVLAACADKWDDHYTGIGDDDDSSGATLNLLEYLESESKYSKFVELLKETKVDQELTRNQVLTVWAPTNETMPEAQIAAMNAADKKMLCQNHINYIALYNTKLSDEKLIKTLAGKNLIITEPSIDVFTIDGHNVVELNQKCTNGVIHDVDGWIIPRKNIYEYLLEAGSEFSVIRDTILSRSDTVFKPSLSYPLGVDELGNTIYDSVFVIENSLFNTVDLRDEDNDYTLFIPSNEVINNMYKEMHEYFQDISHEMTMEDSTEFFSWMLKSIFYKDKVEDYSGSFYSAFGNEWRGDKQHLKPDLKVCSNGYVYEIEKLYIPRFLYVKSLQSYCSWIGEIPEPERNNYFSVTGSTGSPNWKAEESGRTYVYLGNTMEGTEFMMKTVRKNNAFQVVDAKIMPGIYDIYVSFRTYLNGAVDIYINDEFVFSTPILNSNSGIYNYDNPLLETNTQQPIIKNFEVKEEWGYNMLEYKFIQTTAVSGSSYSRLSPYFIMFEPVGDNY